ncbi:hypothetical protein SD28_03240 [Allofrancisella guangzhouensis]|uniref:HTH luxR-type domain-containing protein n=3 Tax=Allofrancisella guangzhouensis TaxID=594679 RepID=A0A0A8E451_9GAMM|nr:helix-turn-helix transcriptional regulator [Allofrancisella guangzhouensis]AJC48724.1 hypothetical protein SD28_03240 [Allofrancisella guangzhouensis]MBK2027397.1 helix-turn-helix transcriptional regulator [Allofrancisella guangzhouensis]MBK2045187.1 helix-turn-helix transcriptional regulator [Allofrancisella guangzhouensis]
MINYFPDNVEALEFAKSMKTFMLNVIADLSKNTYVDNFDYIKFHKNGSILNLATNIKLLEYRFRNNIKYKILFEGLIKEEIIGKPHIYLWPNEPSNQIMKVLFEFGMSNGCSIFICNKNFIEVFSFSSSKGISLNNLYTNKFSYLKQFIAFFKSMYLRYVSISGKEVEYIKTDLKFPKVVKKESKSFEMPKKIYIAENVFLTHKELEVCKYFLKGYSNKKIAQILCKSLRTVETNLNTVKNRLNLNFRDDIVDFFADKYWIVDSL